MKRAMTRREFMRGMAAGAVGVAAVSVLGGCGGSGSSTSGGSSAAPADNAEEDPDAGKHIFDQAKADAAEITLKFANVTTNCSKDAGVYFQNLINEKSNGRIYIDLYQDNMLGDDQVATEGVQVGDIAIVVTAASPLVSTWPDYYLYDAPYLFPDRDAAMNVGMFSDLGRQIWANDELETRGGLKGVGIWENGFRNLTNSVREVKTVADVKGLKLRTMDNDVHLAAWKALGANPSPMAFSELFTALQQKTMDGQENPFAIIVSNKFFEVQPYISKTEHIYAPHIVLMNPDTYKGLPDDLKAIFDECMEEATKKQFEYAISYEETAVKDCEDGGATVTELTAEAKAEFQKVMVDNDIMGMVKNKMDHPEILDQMLAAMA